MRSEGYSSRSVCLCVCLCVCLRLFTPYLSNAVVSAKSPHFFLALVALKLLVSLISRLVACSAGIVADKQTHRTTTVTLAAHARRGLKSQVQSCWYSYRVQITPLTLVLIASAAAVTFAALHSYSQNLTGRTACNGHAC